MAVVGAYELILKKFYPEKFVDLSALFVYYNARILEGARLTDDPGVYIKDALKSVKQQGICADAVWPYNAKNVSCVPTLESYEDAKTRTIKNYYRCDNFDSMLAALSNDIPVVVSMKIYSNFNTFGWQGQSHLTMPDNEEIVGGHSVVIVGYDNGLQHLIARNSFGATWADQGYFYIPYDYARENIMDAWVFDIAVE
jgi:C1A family cysteine protease